MHVFKDFIRVLKNQMTLLGAPISRGHSMDKVLQEKVDDRDRAISRLKYLQADDALARLLYTLRTSDCHDHPLLTRFDIILREGLSLIINVDFDDAQWLQATLLVRNAGIGLRTASTLATSAFLASAAFTEALQKAILPSSHSNVADEPRNSTADVWTSLSSSGPPETCFQRIQKAWDGPVIKSLVDRMVLSANSNVDHPRLKAATAPHSGDWLHAAPMASVGLKLTDEEMRISVAQRLGVWKSSPHTLICGKLADARGLHGLSCRKSTPRHQRHAMLNDIIRWTIKWAHIPAHKEPTGLITHGGKWPDGATLIPWSKGKPLAWDVTVPDTYAESHINMTSSEAGAAARQAASTKNTKYIYITSTHIFYPIAIKTAGSWDVQAFEVIEEIGRRVTEATVNPKETIYIFQKLSMAIQRGNALSFFNTFDKITSRNPSESTIFQLSNNF